MQDAEVGFGDGGAAGEDAGDEMIQTDAVLFGEFLHALAD